MKMHPSGAFNTENIFLSPRNTIQQKSGIQPLLLQLANFQKVPIALRHCLTTVVPIIYIYCSTSVFPLQEKATTNKKDILLDVLSERETSHDVRGTSVLRRPEQSVDLEPSSPGLDSKKIRMILSYHPCFSERETGLEPATPTLARSCSTN